MKPDQAPDKQVKPATDSESDTTSEEEDENDLALMYLKEGVALSHEAAKEDQAGNYLKAIRLYLKTEKCFAYASYGEPVEHRHKYHKACDDYRKRCRELLSYLEEAAKTNEKHRG